jgi:hypothetical protein
MEMQREREKRKKKPKRKSYNGMRGLCACHDGGEGQRKQAGGCGRRKGQPSGGRGVRKKADNDNTKKTADEKKRLEPPTASGRVDQRAGDDSDSGRDTSFATVGIRGTADIQVEVLSELNAVGINVLHPSVEELVDIVQVVLTSAASTRSGGRGVSVSHASEPPIVVADEENEVSAAAVELGLYELGSKLGVGGGVVARTVSSSIGALVFAELEKADFTSSTSLLRVAARLLGCECREKDIGDTFSLSNGFEGVEETGASLEGGVGILEGDVERSVDNIVEGESRGRPASSIVDAAVEPVEGAIWTGSFGGWIDGAVGTTGRVLDGDDSSRRALGTSGG